MSKPTVDLSGLKFGRLTVIERGEDIIRKNGRHSATFICLCDCGNKIQVLASSLKNQNTRSCGCLQRDTVRNLRKSHGKTNSRLYRIWERMRQRCNNPNSTDYQHYGGRGIHICEEWSSYSAFEDWSLSSGYDDGLSIDRIDNSLGYSPDNCRWVSMNIQANNKRNNRILTYNGRTQTLSKWAEETGLYHSTISRRIDIYGWSISDALSKPAKGRKTNESKN